MVVHRRLALCVGLACTALAWASSAAPPDREAALAEIGRYRDQARWLDALAARTDPGRHRQRLAGLGALPAAPAAVRRCPEAAPGRGLPGQAGGLEPGLQQQRRQPPGRGRINPGPHAALSGGRRHAAGAGAAAHPHGPADPAQPPGPTCAGARGSTGAAGRRPHPARLRAARRG
ncbi:hypothetical protein G6F22_017312 [Rhizopus arrhizus]|nr:hypothetical protein G6F23_014397 [Rhizopus arrhizus]KAG0769790.1 hypothetical protein G6F22_017312 [Rhizopus arrhizus]